MNECEKISEMLLGYINQRLPESDKIMVISHIAVCKSCRNEAATLIKIRDISLQEIVSVPDDIKYTAFNKISITCEDENSYKETLDNIFYSLKIVKQTIKLALQVI